MIRAWLKSVFLGWMMFGVVYFVATMITIIMLADEKNDSLIFAETIKHTFFLWLFMVSAIMLSRIKLIKHGLNANIARAIFIGAPIFVGWATFVQFGKDSWFMAGMFVSSVFFVYEVFVVPRAKGKKQS